MIQNEPVATGDDSDAGGGRHTYTLDNTKEYVTDYETFSVPNNPTTNNGATAQLLRRGVCMYVRGVL